MTLVTRGPGRDSSPSQPDTQEESSVRWWWPALASLAVLAVAISLLFPAGRHQWALSLFRQPAHYTVLFFDHASALPARVGGQRPITVSFTVGNHEGHVVVYKYVLSARGGRRPHILREATKAVAAGSTWTVSTRVRPTCGKARRCRIQVSLPGHPETIDFLVTRTRPGE